MRLLRNCGVWGLTAGLVLATGAARAQGVGTRGTTSNNSGSDNSGSGGDSRPVGPYHSISNGGGYSANQSGGGYSANQSGGSYGSGQSGSGTGSHSGMGPNSSSNLPDLGASDVPLNQRQLEEQQAKARNSERQKELVSETQKLVALANELQADVAKSTKDTLSLDVIRKADEIDKLARNVRDKMKNAN